MLLRTYGYSVDVAKDAAWALEAADLRRPDVILLDIALPGMTGWDLARRIRQQSEGDSPLLIAVTGLVRQEDRQHSAEAGIDLHLAKPVDPEQLHLLLNRVREAGPLTSQIRLRAYELWEEAGRPVGQDREHWLQAEREVQAPESRPTQT